MNADRPKVLGSASGRWAETFAAIRRDRRAWIVVGLGGALAFVVFLSAFTTVAENLILGAIRAPGQTEPSSSPSTMQECGFQGIEATVIDAATKAPIKGAHVSALGTSLNQVTDASGRAALKPLDPGDYAVRADSSNYNSADKMVRVVAGDCTRVTIEMRKG
jgi:hypothetical protein